MTDDRFDTAAIRARVLDAWAAAPVRFREDANLEEDLVLGAYRDRVVIELAQNAADAATRAGAPGRVRITLDTTGSGASGASGADSSGGSSGTGTVGPGSSGGPGVPTLTVANTGAPLDAAGVLGLCTLRASSKRDEWDASSGSGPVGRFGVGFSAVLAISDEPAVLSRHGAVRFSAEQARAAVREAAERSPELGAELDRREGRVPALRLPFPAAGSVPQGYDTVVVLPLRDSAAETLVHRLLAEIDDALLLALPQLAEIVVELDGQVRTLTGRREGADGYIVTDGERTTRWRLASAQGDIDPMLLANRPVEERDRPRWSVAWAVPVDRRGEPERLRTVPVVHAPTPTDEPLGLPALLIASLPLDPTRRHAAPGPLTDFLLDRAAEAYARLVEQWPVRTPGLLRLVPGPLAEGALDAELRRRIADLLPDTPFLPAVSAASGAGSGAGSGAAFGAAASAPVLRPREAAFIVPCDDALVAALADAVPGLLPAGWETEPQALAALGARRIDPGELVESLAGLGREASWWGRLYAALDNLLGLDPAARDALAGIPVPLADGRTVRGPRGALLPVTDLDSTTVSALGRLGLRVVHADALAAGHGAVELLERLGAVPTQPRAILADPAVRAAVSAARDEPQLPDDGVGVGIDGDGIGADRVGGDGFGGDHAGAEWDGAGRNDASFSAAPSRSTGPLSPAALAELVLTLVRAADPRPDDRFALGELPLPDERGGLTPARELLLPGSPLAEVVEPGTFGLVDAGFTRRWGADVLRAVGVLGGFTLVRAADILLGPAGVDDLDDELFDLPGIEDWLEDLRGAVSGPDRDAPAVLSELVAVRDLDLVAADRWPRALELLADGELRRAITAPARVVTAENRALYLPSYGAWWLGRQPVLDGRRPTELESDGGLLTGLYDPAPPSRDPEFDEAIGVRTTLSALLDTPGGPDELLDRLADPTRPVTGARLAAIYGALAGVPAERLDPPEALRALVGGVPVVADAAEVAVLDAPDLLPLLGDRPVIAVPPRHAEALADLLDLDLASEAVEGAVTSEGELQQVPDEILALLPEAPDTYFEHDELILDGTTEAEWRVVDGVVHASTFDGLARALAWSAGRWDRRHFVAALLAEPERAAELTAEACFE